MPQGPVDAEAVARVRAVRDEAGRHDRFDVGALICATYVGDPGWDVGRALTGPPEKIAHVLRKFGAFGVGQVQVRFRSRSVDELVDQIERFGAEVIPLLVR